MPDYQKGKIYQLVFGDLPDRYIGSTVQPLKDRLCGHRNDPSPKVLKLIKEVGKMNVKIRLIEEYPCSCKDALLSREQYWMDRLNPNLNTIHACDNYPYTECVKILRERYEAKAEEELLQAEEGLLRAEKARKANEFFAKNFADWRKEINSPHDTPSPHERIEFITTMNGRNYKEECKKYNTRWNDHGCVEYDDTGFKKHWCDNYKTCPENPKNKS